MLRWNVLFYGTILALVDTTMMPITKLVSKNTLGIGGMIIPTLIYALDPWIFLQSLKFETFVVMNFVWDLISDVLVTFMGIVVFGEHISMMKAAGIALSFVSLFLLTYDEK